MGHPQPKPPVHCNNATAVGIANNTIKRQHSRSTEMVLFWIGDKVAQEMYAQNWHLGQENLADYQSKHYLGSHHIAVRTGYLHMENSPQKLPWAARPSTLKGCVGTLKDVYVRKLPFLQAPRIQHASHTSHVTHNTCYLAQVPHISTWSNLTRSLAGLGKRALLPIPLALMQSSLTYQNNLC
jgi:hypothetical protein